MARANRTKEAACVESSHMDGAIQLHGVGHHSGTRGRN
jgi:hypothetical protein